MNDTKKWRIVHIHDFFGSDHWLLSNRKMTDAELDKLWAAARYSFNFNDMGLGYALSGSLIVETVSTDASRKAAEELTIKYNKGDDPIKMMFGETEEGK